MSGVLRWEELPPRRKGSRDIDWAAIAAELALHPGQWAVVIEGPRSTIAGIPWAIRHGTYAAFRPAGFYDAKIRRGADGQAVVYARRVP